MTDVARYFQFLRFCLDGRHVSEDDVAGISWHDLLLFAKKQAIVGVFWQGIQQLGHLRENKPTDDDVMEWMAATLRISRQNKKVNEKAVWTYNNFAHEGFRSCLLKGQGVALYYPTPSLRQSGDIDIWVEGGAEKVIPYIRQFKPKAKACYHHIDFIRVDKIPIEVHYRPSWMSCPWYNRRLQEYFASKSEEQFKHEVSLPDNAGTLAVPTWDFNVVFLLSHIYNHLLHEGIGLRQVIDYYYLLRQGAGKSAEERQALSETLRYVGMRKIGGAIMWVLKEQLGMDSSLLLLPPDARHGKALLREMLKGGNFGKHDERTLSGVYDDAVTSNTQRLWRDLRMVRFFPSECIWEPFFRLYHFFWRKKH